MSDNLQTLASDPKLFRDSLLIDTDGGPRKLGDVVDDWQADRFLARDNALRRVIGQNVQGGKQRFWDERPRGHAKSSDAMVDAAYMLFASSRTIRGVVCAVDKDQAALDRDHIATLARLNPWLREVLDIQATKIVNRITGSALDVISSDVASSYGLLIDFAILDEVSHWAKRDLFDSIISAAAKRQRCLVMAILNAGFRESWAWDVREIVRVDPDWDFARLDGPVASWISEKNLAEQKRLLPPIAFRRLWLNEWSAGSGDAIEAELIDAAIRLDGPTVEREPGWLYVAGVDLGISRDASAVVVVGKHIGHCEEFTKRKPRTSTQSALIDCGVLDADDESESVYHEGTGRLRVCDIRRWKPTPGRRVSVTQVEKSIERLHARFGLSEVAIDIWQAEQLVERMTDGGINTRRVAFTPGNLRGMAAALLEGFSENMIDLYPDEHLIADLCRLRVVEKSYGIRLVSPRTNSGPGSGHGDVATALSLALLSARSHSHIPNRVQHDLVCYP